MAVQTQQMTLEAFERLVFDPQNADRRFEYIGGEAVEVVSNQRSSAIASNVSFFIKLFLREQHIEGFVTGADGGYRIGQDRYMPDVAFVSKARQSEPSEEAYSPVTPNLVVEVLSPSNAPEEMRVKTHNYTAAQVVVWVVHPERQMVEVYIPGQPVQKYGVNDVLEGGDVLPGFRVAVKEIFAG